MPGPAMHHLIVDRWRAHIQTGRFLPAEPAHAARLQALLADKRNLPYLFLGSQGPDFLFFNAKDVNSTVGDLVATYYDVYDFIEGFKRTLLDAVPQPVLDALAAFDEAKDELIEDSALLSELEQTFTDLNNVITAFMALLTEGLKRFVSDFNVFDLVDHPYRDGATPGKWWWFDAMHYRRTGRFASALLEETRHADSPLHLYALGYLTHVTADTVGHPYVNIWSGGPYRSHAQRHKTGENYQDVFNFLGVAGKDWNYSKLHALYNFNYTGTISDDEPDDFTNLPDDLANLLARLLNDVYREDAAPGEYGQTITAEILNDTYRTWYRWFKSATDTGTLPPPVSYSFTKELEEVWEKTVDNLEAAGDLIKNAIDSAGDFGILSIFLILAAAIAAAVLAAAALADGIAGAIATLGTATIRYAACLIYEQLYNAFQNFRLAVALNGLAFPMREHLAEPRFQQFINPAQPDPTGVNASSLAGFMPRLRWQPSLFTDPLGLIFSRERHLVYPPTAGERRATWAAPPSYYSALPTHYAWGDVPLHAALLQELRDFPGNDAPDETTMQSRMNGRTLGNAVDLSSALYRTWFLHGDGVPDFNLDGDRGYGYLCWTQVTDDGADPPNRPGPLRTHVDGPFPPPEVGLEIIT